MYCIFKFRIIQRVDNFIFESMHILKYVWRVFWCNSLNPSQIKKTITLFFFSLLMVLSVSAQNVRTSQLTWSVNELTDLNKNVSASYSCLFKTDGLLSISWDQSAYDTSLGVQQADGQWSDVSMPGQITYSISLDGETGTIVFERTASGVYITLDLSQPNGGRLRHRYSVSQVTASN